jgi:peroxiredoxin
MTDSILQNHQPAPSFSLPDLEGKTHSLADYRGRIAILNFWSAECHWSARRDAELIPLLDQWGHSVVLLSIATNSHEGLELISQAAWERRLPTVLLDRNQSVADQYFAQTTPHFFVIDQHGILRYQGAFDDMTFRQRTATRHYLVEAIEDLVAGRLPDLDVTPPYGCAIVRHLL